MPWPAGPVGADGARGNGLQGRRAAGVLVGAIALAGAASGTATTNQPTPFISPNAGLALVTAAAPSAEGRGDLPVERISDPLGLTALTPGSSLAAVDAPLTLEALED